MKVYIAGPIKGYVDANRPAFKAMEDRLRELGFEPVNPHDCLPEHTVGPACVGEIEHEHGGGHRYGCHIRADLAALLSCDGYVLLPGWKDSRGARMEDHVCRTIGMFEVRLP